MGSSWAYNVPRLGLTGLGLRVISAILPLTSEGAVGTLEDFPHQGAIFVFDLSLGQLVFSHLLPYDPAHPNMPYGLPVVAP